MEYGWRDEMKAYCKSIINKYTEGLVFRIYFIEIVKQKGLDYITVDEKKKRSF